VLLPSSALSHCSASESATSRLLPPCAAPWCACQAARVLKLSPHSAQMNPAMPAARWEAPSLHGQQCTKTQQRTCEHVQHRWRHARCRNSQFLQHMFTLQLLWGAERRSLHLPPPGRCQPTRAPHSVQIGCATNGHAALVLVASVDKPRPRMMVLKSIWDPSVLSC
jgi:hypothetical protein